MKKNFYVDDCLKSVPTTEAAVKLIYELCKLLSTGGFHLTKFLSNSREVMKAIPESERCKAVAKLNLDLEDLPSDRALGVLWSVEDDTLTYNTSLKEKPMTKRGLLSVMSSVYNFLGLVGPFILKAKMLFQKLCHLQCSWDQTMPDDIADQWGRWMEDLHHIHHLKVPRCITPSFTFEEAQLHHFADASQDAYGAVSYLQVTNGTHRHVSC